MDYSVIARAGLTQAHFARIVGVSRVTVSTWLNGHHAPGPKMHNLVARALKLLKDAVSDGELPLDNTKIDRILERRLERISKAIRRGA